MDKLKSDSEAYGFQQCREILYCSNQYINNITVIMVYRYISKPLVLVDGIPLYGQYTGIPLETLASLDIKVCDWTNKDRSKDIWINISNCFIERRTPIFAMHCSFLKSIHRLFRSSLENSKYPNDRTTPRYTSLTDLTELSLHTNFDWRLNCSQR